MKRKLCFLLVLAVCLFALAGCSSSQSRLEAEAATGIVLQTPEAPPAWGMVNTAHLGSVYLYPDGTVSSNYWRWPELQKEYPGMYDHVNDTLATWTGIVAADIGLSHIVGLKADGTVLQVALSADPGSAPDVAAAVAGWTDIVAICAEGQFILGLRTDGTVAVAGDEDLQKEIAGWKDITRICAGFDHALGLKADGTVVAAGSNEFGQCNVSDWTDIVAISADGGISAGLKADGTIVMTGAFSFDPEQAEAMSISGWDNVAAISAGPERLFALTGDGKVLQYPEPSEQGLMAGAADWTDIVAISASYHLLGLKADGTILALGGNMGGECDVCRLQPETAEHAFDEIGCLVCGYPAPAQ